jgi:GT2 family glycosyltransferase
MGPTSSNNGAPGCRVSVIIPTYNNGAYLGQAIESVLQQDYADYEIVVVDDGSTDETQDLLVRYDAAIHAVRQEHAGVSQARNRGLQLARGEYIVFLDGDDLLLPSKLTTQVAFLEERPDLGYAHSGWHRIDENGERIDTVEPWHQVAELTLENWLIRKPVFMGAMLVRRHWVERAGGFDTALPQGEDLKLFFQMVLLGCKGGWVYQPTVCYRQHQGSLTKNRVQMLASSNRVVAEFFAQPNLPPDIHDLKDKVGFGTLVWSAWQLHVAGHTTDVAEFLSQSLAYDHSKSPVKTIQRWLHTLFYACLNDGHKLEELHAFWPHIKAAIGADESFWKQIEPALGRWLRCFAVLEANH